MATLALPNRKSAAKNWKSRHGTACQPSNESLNYEFPLPRQLCEYDMQQMKTYMARPGEIEPKWWLVDASDKVVGRLASDLAMVLMGKNRPTYTPHVDNGDYVVVINADKVVLTGKKWEQKEYAHPGIRS
jgi:hypothetical protein